MPRVSGDLAILANSLNAMVPATRVWPCQLRVGNPYWGLGNGLGIIPVPVPGQVRLWYAFKAYTSGMGINQDAVCLFHDSSHGVTEPSRDGLNICHLSYYYSCSP